MQVQEQAQVQVQEPVQEQVQEPELRLVEPKSVTPSVRPLVLLSAPAEPANAAAGVGSGGVGPRNVVEMSIKFHGNLYEIY